MEKLFIPIVLGTAREGRQSEKVARFLLEEAKKQPDIETTFVDVKDFLFGHTARIADCNPGAKPWQEIADRADGFLFVVPE